MRQILFLSLFLICLLVLGGCRKNPAAPASPPKSSASPAKTGPASRSADEIALLNASIKGDTATAKTLLDRGVNPNTKDGDGRTPLTEASFYGHTEIAKMLLAHGADVFAKKIHGETVLDMASGHKDIADLIKAEMDLLGAAGKGDAKLVKELLDKGAYPNVRDPDGRTPLTESVWNNHVEVVKLLLDKGADPNQKKNDGATPLSIATGKGYKELVELLKKAGAK
jgi:uncharacterized protein